MVSVQFFIPFLILVYCYGRIVWVLTRRIGSSIGDYNAADNVQSKFQTARTNTIKTFLLVGICFIICWSNNQIYYLMYLLGFDADWNSIYYRFTILMIFLNCTVNPFIYILKYKDYQVSLRDFLKCVNKVLEITLKAMSLYRYQERLTQILNNSTICTFF